jgi:hypothetical protein
LRGFGAGRCVINDLIGFDAGVGDGSLRLDIRF